MIDIADITKDIMALDKITDIYEAHHFLMDKLNNATDMVQHIEWRTRLRGFRTAARILGYELIQEADWYYINQGIDRPMCCGEFLDWKPKEK